MGCYITFSKMIYNFIDSRNNNNEFGSFEISNDAGENTARDGGKFASSLLRRLYCSIMPSMSNAI